MKRQRSFGGAAPVARYVAAETCVAILINAALGGVITALVCHPAALAHATYWQAVGQLVMPTIGPASMMVPGLTGLTRGRVIKGSAPPVRIAALSWLPVNMIARTIVIGAAALALMASTGGCLLWLYLHAATPTLARMIAFMIGYGAIYGLVIAPVVILAALSDTTGRNIPRQRAAARTACDTRRQSANKSVALNLVMPYNFPVHVTPSPGAAGQGAYDMTAIADGASAPSNSKWLHVGLWVAQILLALAFCLFGFLKVTAPIEELSKSMPWTGQLPLAFVRSIGVIDILGGLGILLPAIARILPWLTVWAAAGCTALQLLAILFHSSRGEFQVLPLNFILLPLAAFILWGRASKLPIRER